MDYTPQTLEEFIKDLESKGYTITPPKRPTGRMKVLPEEGTEYWSINCYSDTDCLTYEGDVSDLERFIPGNFYHDKESAEQAKPEYEAWLNSTAKVLSRIAELNPEGWELKFKPTGRNFCFEEDAYGMLYITSETDSKSKPASHYMATREIAEQILEEMPEDVERMIRR